MLNVFVLLESFSKAREHQIAQECLGFIDEVTDVNHQPEFVKNVMSKIMEHEQAIYKEWWRRIVCFKFLDTNSDHRKVKEMFNAEIKQKNLIDANHTPKEYAAMLEPMHPRASDVCSQFDF